jgi:hypothetical protein
MTARAVGGDGRFRFTKWYFDCVSADARVFVGYWATLSWRRLALTWQNVAIYEPGRAPWKRASLLKGPPPEVRGERIDWNAPALNCTVHVQSRQAAIHQRLLEVAEGAVDWCAESPAALVCADIAGKAPLQGAGYAERIVMTIPPWRLPIDELRWGRWLDRRTSRSVVWIDWRGPAPRTWIFVDGSHVAGAVSDEGPSAGALSLRVGHGRALESISFAQIAETIPPLPSLVPKSLLALKQTRWCSPARLEEAGRATNGGLAVHEVAVFR